MIINYSDEKVKKDQKSNNNQNGVITIMLRDAAMTASENPYSLDEFENGYYK